jgi:hypothetical protein
MNKYKVAETIVAKIVADLKTRMDQGDKWDVADEDTNREIVDKWEDIIISEIEKAENVTAPAASVTAMANS